MWFTQLTKHDAKKNVDI